MNGHGYYNRHSILQAAAAELGIAALREAASVVPLPKPPNPLIVADYGCSQGQNSLRPMGEAVSTLRERTERAVTVVHTDLPSNDFSSVFEVVSTDPSSYLRTDANAYALAAGRSFYEEILPPGSVALGWSATTTHWLGDLPVAVPGHLAAMSSDDPAIQQRFAQQAAADWDGFLGARAAELQPGGRLVLVESCTHPDGHVGSEDLFALMDEVLAELVAEGEIAAEAAAQATLPLWMRTPEEYSEPIDSHPGLETVSARVVEDQRSPLWTRFEQDGDVDAYAAASIASMRAWSGAMLAAAITDPAILDEYYERCRDKGVADPDRLHLQVFHIVLDIARR
jgi:hypothetical protein